MANNANSQLASAKENFAKSLDDFDPFLFVKKKPTVAIGLALAAGAAIGLLRLPKIKSILHFSPFKGLIRRVIGK